MKMKRFVTFIFLAASFVCSSLYADGGIYLPDLTTVVEDNSEVFVPEIKMELTGGIEIPEGAGSYEIKLPEPEPEPEEPVEEVVEEIAESSLTVQGYVGAGWPGHFYGNINLYNYGNDPSYLNMSYFSMDKDKVFASDGGITFFSKNQNHSFNLNGSFLDNEKGFQNLYEASPTYNRKQGTLDFKYSVSLPKDFAIYAGVKGDYYSRTMAKENACTFMDLYPEFKGRWNYKNFALWLDGNYLLTSGFDSMNHRGYTGLGLLWESKYVILEAGAGAVFGTNIGEQKVLVPFKGSVNTHFPVPFSDFDMGIALEGGMETCAGNNIETEQMTDFCASRSLLSESSDWYGNLGIFIPVLSSISLNITGEYRKTAFGNGIWQADTEASSLVKGLYGFAQKDRQLITLSETASYNSRNWEFLAGWTSYFDFVPEISGIYPQAGTFMAMYRGDRLDLTGTLILPLLSSDNTPVVNLEGSLKVNSALRIAICMEDTVKLINGHERPGVGQYYSRGGNASLKVKFEY